MDCRRNGLLFPFLERIIDLIVDKTGRQWVCGDTMYFISFETKCGSERSHLLKELLKELKEPGD